MNKHERHIVNLEALGGLIEVRCRYVGCAAGIEYYFRPLISKPWRSPDVIIYCDWKEGRRELFRARSVEQGNLLEGVRYRMHGDQESSPWRWPSAPIPPFVLPPFRDRFVGLHGGAVCRPQSQYAMLLIGPQGSGKTTLCLKLVHDYSFKLLTDETVVLHRRSSMIEPFPRAVGISNRNKKGHLEKQVVPADDAFPLISRSPGVADQLIFLDKSPGADWQIAELQPGEVFQRLLPHHLNLGSDASECFISLYNLATNVRGMAVRIGAFDDFSAIASLLEATVTAAAKT
jgi:hypothetical protein